jgi:sugar-specific transcriptional regulator TrmB
LVEGRTFGSKVQQPAAYVATPPEDMIVRIPEELSVALSRIVSQLDIISQTVANFESRLDSQEQLMDKFRHDLVLAEHERRERELDDVLKK